MTTYRLDIAYDGAGFSGWARQPGRRTVQRELEEALERLFDDAVALTVAGRTDAGVHAVGQVASFTAAKPPPDSLARALNALTGPDVAVLRAEAAAPGFDARRDATSRRYRYRVETARVASPFERGRALHWSRRLDVEALERCAAAMIGTHDFSAFTPSDTDHVHFHRRVLDAAWTRESDSVLRFEVEADAFMRSMVRALVGTMLEVGGERRSVPEFIALLAGRPRAEAGETAAPHGLYLIGVNFD